MATTGASSDEKETNFRKVIEFNLGYGVIPSRVLSVRRSIIEGDISNGGKRGPSDEKELSSAMNLIREEVKELEEAVEQHDFVETIDALGDILYVVYGMGARLGVDMDEAFRLIHENNMEKFCATEKEAKLSAEAYMADPSGLHKNVGVRRAATGDRWVVFNEDTKKILKSITWKSVELDAVCRQKTARDAMTTTTTNVCPDEPLAKRTKIEEHAASQ